MRAVPRRHRTGRPREPHPASSGEVRGVLSERLRDRQDAGPCRRANGVPGGAPGREARRRSSCSRRAVAIALSPCANASSTTSSPRRRPVWAVRRRWTISVPTDSAATSSARCDGPASSGNAESRRIPAAPNGPPSAGPDRSRGGADRVTSVRGAGASADPGDSGGSKRNESAAAPQPRTIASAAL